LESVAASTSAEYEQKDLRTHIEMLGDTQNWRQVLFLDSILQTLALQCGLADQSRAKHLMLQERRQTECSLAAVWHAGAGSAEARQAEGRSSEQVHLLCSAECARAQRHVAGGYHSAESCERRGS
jgi:hypothetical protein